MPRILAQVGTPAKPPKVRGKSLGRPVQGQVTPAPRYPVVCKPKPVLTKRRKRVYIHRRYCHCLSFLNPCLVCKQWKKIISFSKCLFPERMSYVASTGLAGLYFALLMKQLDPSHRRTGIEQNPAGATYGWGVVFSERALSCLRESDPES